MKNNDKNTVNNDTLYDRIDNKMSRHVYNEGQMRYVSNTLCTLHTKLHFQPS